MIVSTLLMPFLFEIVFFAFNPENALQLSLSFSSRLVYDCISEKVPTHGRLGGAGGSLSNIKDSLLKGVFVLILLIVAFASHFISNPYSL